MYKLLSRPLFLILLLFIFYSCTPRIIVNEDISTKESDKGELEKIDKKEVDEVDIDQKVAEINQTSSDPIYINPYSNKKIESEIVVILPSDNNIQITQNFINALELSIYKKNIKNLSLNINTYSSKKQLYEIIGKNIRPGRIYIGPLTSNDTKGINEFCSSGVIFFSFASDRNLASDCVYLINFFPAFIIYGHY